MSFMPNVTRNQYHCLSTDTKPTTGINSGDTCRETDTGAEYIFNGTAWSVSKTRTRAADTITLGTGAAHSAGDVVSTDAGEILEFSTGLTAGASGIILSSVVSHNNNAVFSGGAGYDLYLFNASPAAQATNAAFDMTEADLAKYIGKVTISTLVDIGSTCAITNTGHNLDFTLASADTKLYGKLVCLGGETTITGKIISIALGIASL